MHRDAKLGLALGILVIGFAGAFCFPRHAGLPARGTTADVSTDSLVQHLALRDVRVYTTARHPDEIAPAPSAIPLLTEPASVVTPPGDTDSPTVAGLTSVFGKRPLVAAPQADSDQDLDPAEEAPPIDATYTVRPGDTLSSIALKHLGSSARYGDLFESNRELLGSPDALQIGMVLRIPPRERPAPTQVAEGRSEFETSRRTDGTPAAPRFRPSRSEPSGAPLPTSKEPQPTPADSPLPTTAIPVPRAPSATTVPQTGVVPRSRFGAASVGASLRGFQSDHAADPVN